MPLLGDIAIVLQCSGTKYLQCIFCIIIIFCEDKNITVLMYGGGMRRYMVMHFSNDLIQMKVVSSEGTSRSFPVWRKCVLSQLIMVFVHDTLTLYNVLFDFELFLSYLFLFCDGGPIRQKSRLFEVGADQTRVESFADINGGAQREVPPYYVWNDCVFRRCMSHESMLSSSIPRYVCCSTSVSGTPAIIIHFDFGCVSFSLIS